MTNNTDTDLGGYSREPMEMTLMREADDTAHGRRLRAALGVLSVEDLSLMLGISEGTIKNWRAYQHGPQAIKIGKFITLYDVDTVRAWIVSHARENLGAEDSE